MKHNSIVADGPKRLREAIETSSEASQNKDNPLESKKLSIFIRIWKYLNTDIFSLGKKKEQPSNEEIERTNHELKKYNPKDSLFISSQRIR